MTSPALLDVRGIRKHFPGVQALDDVAMSLAQGEVLAIVGENGAGKSTLMKILAGIHTPDEGTISLEGHEVRLSGVGDALAHGICLIHQELNLADDLTISANLFLGREKVRGGPLGWLDHPAMHSESEALLARVGLDSPPTQRLHRLKTGQQQLVEIARALGMNARILIMDEPTSSLTQSEADRLFDVIDVLRADGVAIVYISHRLAEVKRLADRVVVLRDGKNAGSLAREEIDHDALVRLMVGRELTQLYPRQHAEREPGPIRLEVSEFLYEGGGELPMNFAIRGGEIVGMAGLVGAGRTELAEALFGIRHYLQGEVRLDGTPMHITHPKQAIAAGLLLVPEDRRQHGLLTEFDIRENAVLPNLDRVERWGFVDPTKGRELTTKLMAELQVRASGPHQKTRLLSGGNQQKVVLGKWLARNPSVLILDEPTRGVDVGAREEIYGLVDQLAVRGVAILMISSDLEEVLGMSDRVLVLNEGNLVGELSRDELSEEAVMQLATRGAVGQS